MRDIIFVAQHIAPCGANCATCMGFLRSENRCPGCRMGDDNKPRSCARCVIRNCDELENNHHKYCFECSGFPCKRLIQLDHRYQTNYAFSMIANLRSIAANGLGSFLQTEQERWVCSKCGGVICVHRGFCSECGEIRYVHTGTHRAQIR